MPLYRNQCEACGYRFRTLERRGPSDVAVCPACGSEETQRLLARVAIQFKGSGYYKTDHARRGNGSTEGRTSEKGSTVSAIADD